MKLKVFVLNLGHFFLFFCAGMAKLGVSAIRSRLPLTGTKVLEPSSSCRGKYPREPIEKKLWG